ncbi:MAG: hypothetical protein AAB920_03285, partial [Patescibacteria group bacterium]
DKIQNPRRISKTLVSVLRTLLPENSFRKNESIFAFLHLASFSQIISGEVQGVSPHFCFSRSSVLCTEALQRAGNASLSFFLGNKFEQMI